MNKNVSELKARKHCAFFILRCSNSLGYTGEWYEGYIQLLHLRARWYAPETGTFLSRDPVESEPPYAYVRGNVINVIDPSGLYGVDVHFDLTYDLAIKEALLFKDIVTAKKLALKIAGGDQHVDDSFPDGMLDAVVGCNECHFEPLSKTMRHVYEAIRKGNPFLFGATLHQYQDWYSHWNEGYTHKHLIWYEHATQSESSKRLKIPGGEYRSRDLIDDFFQGYHDKGLITIPSPYPPHPRSDVVKEVMNRNPGLTFPIDNYSNILIDLYLRGPSNPERFQQRYYFRFYTDRYIEGSTRDMDMKRGTESLIGLFLIYNSGPCEIEWEKPSDVDIKVVLTR